MPDTGDLRNRFRAPAADPDHQSPSFGVKNRPRREKKPTLQGAPLLMPCTSPYGIAIATLACVAKLIENGYHPEDVEHYAK
jgi:hypothetical protein